MPPRWSSITHCSSAACTSQAPRWSHSAWAASQWNSLLSLDSASIPAYPNDTPMSTGSRHRRLCSPLSFIMNNKAGVLGLKPGINEICLLTYQNRHRAPGFPASPNSYLLLGAPAPYPELSSLGSWLPFPQLPFLVYSSHFSYASLLAGLPLLVGSSSLSPLLHRLTWSSSVWSCSDSPRCPCLWLCFSLFIYSKFSLL